MKNDIVDMEQYKWNIESVSEYAEVMISTQAKIEWKKIIQRTISREIELEQLWYHVRNANFWYMNKKVKTVNGRVTIQDRHPIEWEWVIEIFTSRASWYLTDEEIVNNLNLKSVLTDIFISCRHNTVRKTCRLELRVAKMRFRAKVCNSFILHLWLRVRLEAILSLL